MHLALGHRTHPIGRRRSRPSRRWHERAAPVSGAKYGSTVTHLRFGDFCIDTAQSTLVRGSTKIAVEPKVFACIELLASRAGQLISRDHLRQALWPDVRVGPAAAQAADPPRAQGRPEPRARCDEKVMIVRGAARGPDLDLHRSRRSVAPDSFFCWRLEPR
jgi:hypothetical protein